MGSINHFEVKRKVLPDGILEILPVAPSREVMDHSPDFSWGYTGSGPSQLALSLLLDVTHDPMESVIRHQTFKDEVVVGWNIDGGWIIKSSDIWKWLRTKQMAEFEIEARRPTN